MSATALDVERRLIQCGLRPEWKSFKAAVLLICVGAAVRVMPHPNGLLVTARNADGTFANEVQPKIK
jgi:predicted acyltransferase